MTIRMTAAALAFAALALPPLALSAQTRPDRISFLLGSEHIGASGYEEFNPGVFATWTNGAFQGRADVSVGGFRNSYGDGSLAVSLALPLVREATWGIDVFSALAWYPGNGDRFKYHAGDIVPLFGLQSRIGPTFIQYVPGGDRGVDATLGFGLTFPLGY